jgi:5-methylcytosine-specific restriction endonuclease McrA
MVAWRFDSPEAVRRFNRFQRTKRKLKLDIWAKTGGLCWYCGTRMQWQGTTKNGGAAATTWTVDHIIPLSQGGTDDLHNLVPCCKSCNSRKQTRGVEYLRQILSGIPSFTPKQRDWLQAQGFRMPAAQYVFWFERGW